MEIPKPDPFTTCHPDTVRALLGLSEREELELRGVVRGVYRREMADKGADAAYDVRWGNLQKKKPAFVANMIAEASTQIKNNTGLEQQTKDIIGRAKWYIEWALGLYHKGRQSPKKAIIGGSEGEAGAEAGAEAGTEAGVEAGDGGGGGGGGRVVYRPWEWPSGR